MGWMQDRDLLIAETLAFVKQVKGDQPETTAPVRIVPIEVVKQIEKPAQPSEFEPLKFERMAPRVEIAARLASFKATHKIPAGARDLRFDHPQGRPQRGGSR